MNYKTGELMASISLPNFDPQNISAATLADAGQPFWNRATQSVYPPGSSFKIITTSSALQNIPEGMVIIGPMLAAGISPRKTLVCGMATGLVEVIGTLLGYYAVTVATAILPFALAFAGGTMLYVISDEMIPETHHDNESGATYALLVGFCVMLVSDVLLG